MNWIRWLNWSGLGRWRVFHDTIYWLGFILGKYDLAFRLTVERMRTRKTLTRDLVDIVGLRITGTVSAKRNDISGRGNVPC